MAGDTRRVSDLQLAASLLARDFKLLGVEGPLGRKDFIFENVPESAVLAFYQGTDALPARKLFDAHRTLKGLTLQAL